eukprot:4057947-Pyramimonas_sp.AAC.1
MAGSDSSLVVADPIVYPPISSGRLASLPSCYSCSPFMLPHCSVLRPGRPHAHRLIIPPPRPLYKAPL